MGRVRDSPRNEEGNAGQRGDARDHIAFKINRKRPGFAPRTPLFCLAGKDYGRAEHGPLKCSDLAGEMGDAGTKALVSSPTAVNRDDLCRDNHVTSPQIRRKSTSNPETDQAICAVDDAFDESGGAFPVSRTDKDGKARRPRDSCFSG